MLCIKLWSFWKCSFTNADVRFFVKRCIRIVRLRIGSLKTSKPRTTFPWVDFVVIFNPSGLSGYPWLSRLTAVQSTSQSEHFAKRALVDARWPIARTRSARNGPRSPQVEPWAGRAEGPSWVRLLSKSSMRNQDRGHQYTRSHTTFRCSAAAVGIALRRCRFLISLIRPTKIEAGSTELLDLAPGTEVWTMVATTVDTGHGYSCMVGMSVGR